jgi:hypothetical protein
MQRIGRVDRRRNQDIENLLLSDHPKLSADRDKILEFPALNRAGAVAFAV